MDFNFTQEKTRCQSGPFSLDKKCLSYRRWRVVVRRFGAALRVGFRRVVALRAGALRVVARRVVLRRVVGDLATRRAEAGLVRPMARHFDLTDESVRRSFLAISVAVMVL